MNGETIVEVIYKQKEFMNGEPRSNIDKSNYVLRKMVDVGWAYKQWWSSIARCQCCIKTGKAPVQ
jgi:hypothetical protein